MIRHRPFLFAANWKMNMNIKEAGDFFEKFSRLIRSADFSKEIDIPIAPPFTLLSLLQSKIFSPLSLAVQNLHWLNSGAHTGEISPSMVKEFGVKYAILGHSERRQFYGETSSAVAMRAKSAIENEISPIVCVGESKGEYEANRTKEVVSEQLRNSLKGIEPNLKTRLVIAYEPIWAIGTGLTATSEIISSVHAFIRNELKQLLGSEISHSTQILYGGSVKPENIQGIIALNDVDGALVGGASLDAETFFNLISLGIK